MRPATESVREAGTPTRRRPYLIALACTLALPVVVTVLVWALLPHAVAPGRCEGIGFGCVPSPATTFLLWALVVGVPVVLVASVAACGVIAWRRARRRPE